MHAQAQPALARRIAIIGAGISGLAAGLRLRELLPESAVTIFEAGERPGGVLRTVRRDGFLIETSADSFITSFPWALNLCDRLGLAERIIPTDAAHRRAFVVRRGRLLPIPDGLMIMAPSRLGPLVRSAILSPWGKLRMAAEAFVPRGSGADESLASFVRRRFGREAFDRLIQPLVGGMYTGDPERLSVLATMPRFVEMEQRHGSLIRAMRSKNRSGNEPNQGSGARYGLFVGLTDGMSELVDAICNALPSGTIRCNCRVSELTRDGQGRWGVRVAAESEPAWFDRVVVAASAPHTQQLLSGIDAEFAAGFRQVPSNSSAIASLGYRREQIEHRLDGFGFVVPSAERLPILSGSFSSVKFPGRAPAGHVLVRVFLGGATRPDLLEQNDDSLIRLAHEQLARLIGIRGEPILSMLSRWNKAMPQYQIGHLQWLETVRSRLAEFPGLELAGNAYEGIGVPQCVHSGETAAERIAAS
jgi:oxygen-dependent protoporphyrinogen oxidase